MFVSIPTIKLFHLKKQNTNTVIIIHPHIKLSFRRPLTGPQVTIPDDPFLRVPLRVPFRVPLRICLLHVTSPYRRNITGGLGRAKQCNCKQPIQELIHALLSSVCDESIMWLRQLELFTDILRYIYSAQFALNELELRIYR